MSSLLSWSRKGLSWPALVALLVLLSGGAVSAAAAVQKQSETRAVGQAIDGSKVIVELVVRRNVDPADFLSAGGLRGSEVADMQADVDRLQAGGQVVGLEVWRMNGAPLFIDAGHPLRETTLPQHERTRALSGSAWVLQGTEGERGKPTADVFLPLPARDGAVVGVVEVLLPQQPLTNRIRAAARWSEAAAVVVLVLLCAGLLVARRRLRRRESQARHDPLTGLLNRAALVEDANPLLRKATDKHPTALLVLDLAGFKSVNNTLGHTAGDALLSQVAATLRRAVRPNDLVARLGGDKFAVLVPGLPADASNQILVAEHLLQRLQTASFDVCGVALAVDASIGVALAPVHGSSAEELLRCGDVAMYVAKHEHSGWAVYDPTSDHHDVRQLGLLVELRKAIEHDELVLHYQPQVALGDGAVVGVEALVRWQHPQRGLLSPMEFIPLAESTGLIRPLTEWVLRTAIEQAASWQRTGAPLRVAVNISPRTLLEGHLPTQLLSVLADAGLPASLLELEITETAVIGNPQRAEHVLRRLDAMGIKVSIDDFGAGFTSLAYLKSLPVKAIKIDRSFVTDMLDQPEDQAITEAVIGLGHRLGLLVLAEGVETEAVYRRLRELGCDEAQGYLLSRPLPPAALEGWLADWQLNHPTATGPTTCERSPAARTPKPAAT
jgi:diguanylate cyclase (GGDEF)-like protein